MQDTKQETALSAQERYFALLGDAFAVPLQTTAFEQFLETAHTYFVGEPGKATMAPDFPRRSGTDASLDAHTQRLIEVFDAALEAEARTKATPDHYHAILSIDARLGQVEGNDAAQALLQSPLPCPLDDLPLDHDALQQVKATLYRKLGDREDRIMLAMVGSDRPKPCLGLIQRGADDDQSVLVSLSYIHWSEALLGRLGDAFGLTPAETDVLAGYLNQQSQKQIAEDRDRSIETVKGQSKTILRKTGCTRMADVVRLSASIAYLLRQMPEAEPNQVALTEWATPKANLKTLTRGTRTLSWYSHGKGQRALLFIHGLIMGPFLSQDMLVPLIKADIRVLAPSRPGYGLTSRAGKKTGFIEDTVTDALTILEEEKVEHVTIVAHQLGTSHAHRIAAALGGKANALILLNGSVPIDDSYFASMERRTRFAGVAIRHAPSVLKMATELGIRNFKRKGVEDFLRDRYKVLDVDRNALEDPETMRLHAYGVFHMTEQGPHAFIDDQTTKLSDWSDAFTAPSCPCFWLQPGACRIIHPEHVERYVRDHSDAHFEVMPEAGSLVLYAEPEAMSDFILKAMAKAGA